MMPLIFRFGMLRFILFSLLVLNVPLEHSCLASFITLIYMFVPVRVGLSVIKLCVTIDLLPVLEVGPFVGRVVGILFSQQCTNAALLPVVCISPLTVCGPNYSCIPLQCAPNCVCVVFPLIAFSLTLDMAPCPLLLTSH